METMQLKPAITLAVAPMWEIHNICVAVWIKTDAQELLLSSMETQLKLYA